MSCTWWRTTPTLVYKFHPIFDHSLSHLRLRGVGRGTAQQLKMIRKHDETWESPVSSTFMHFHPRPSIVIHFLVEKIEAMTLETPMCICGWPTSLTPVEMFKLICWQSRTNRFQKTHEKRKVACRDLRFQLSICLGTVKVISPDRELPRWRLRNAYLGTVLMKSCHASAASAWDKCISILLRSPVQSRWHASVVFYLYQHLACTLVACWDSWGRKRVQSVTLWKARTTKQTLQVLSIIATLIRRKTRRLNI